MSLSTQHEVTRDILIKAIESGYIPRVHPSENGSFDKNLKIITKAYKEIFKTVNNPLMEKK